MEEDVYITNMYVLKKLNTGWLAVCHWRYNIDKAWHLERKALEAVNHKKTLSLQGEIFRYVPPQRVGFCAPFWSENGVDFAHFGLESGFWGNTGVYERIFRFNSKWVRKRNKRIGNEI